MGLGKDYDRYSIGGMYGVVPEGISGGPLIETVTLRQTYSFFDWERINIYGGLNVFHVLGVKYMTSEYGESPDGYYPLGSIRGLLYMGISAAFNADKTRFFYFESGYNDLSIENLVNANNDVVNPLEEISLALGIKQIF